MPSDPINSGDYTYNYNVSSDDASDDVEKINGGSSGQQDPSNPVVEEEVLAQQRRKAEILKQQRAPSPFSLFNAVNRDDEDENKANRNKKPHNDVSGLGG